MTKTEAIQCCGGTVQALADAVGVSGSAISQWPEELPPRLRDRVQAALYRRLEACPVCSADTDEAPAHDG